MPSDQIISCDWGTSSLRIRLVSASDRKVLARISSAEGIATVAAMWSASHLPEKNKPAFYFDVIKEKLANLPGIAGGNVPLLISGMAASSIGFCELPYANVPLSLKKPALVTRKFQPGELFAGPAFLVSGLKTSADVMRGEETLILGLPAVESGNSLVILPGTHSKQAFIGDAHVTGFRTFMTGELFSALRHHTVLKYSMPEADPGFNRAAFVRGVVESKDGNLLNVLFGVRALRLLHQLAIEESYDYLSGLLIGHELHEAKSFGGDIILVADDEPAERYRLAIKTLGERELTVVPAEEACVAGHCRIAETLLS